MEQKNKYDELSQLRSQLQSTNQFKHWQFELDHEGILWMQLDRQNSAVNSLNQAILTELDAILDLILHFRSYSKLIAVVIYSGKKNGFIAGADITQFPQADTFLKAFALMWQAQTVLEKLSCLSIPTFALIHGYCLGGGLELALSCDYRLAVNSEHTQLGFPELHLGLHPGWGGTVRSPHLIGAIHAMRMLLTGQSISATQALAWKLVDEVMSADAFDALSHRDQVKLWVIKTLNQDASQHGKYQKKYWQSLSWCRSWMSCYYYYRLSHQVDKRHYPAAYTIVDNWRQDGGLGQSAYRNEAYSIARLLATKSSQQQIRLFLLKSKMKNLGRGALYPLTRLHIIGCSRLGTMLAARALQQGLIVSSSDDNNAVQIELADVVIEVVDDNLLLKQRVLSEVAPRLKKNAIVLTTTSRFRLSDLLKTTSSSQSVKLMGFHRINTTVKNEVNENEVVEMVQNPNLDPIWMVQAAAFAVRLGFLPVNVPDVPGYLLMRVLMPYLKQAMHLADEGIAMIELERAAYFFGMQIGPFQLADAIGLDVCALLMQELLKLKQEALPCSLQERIIQKQLGIQSRQGFYYYSKLSERYPWLRNILPSERKKLINRKSTVLTANLITQLLPVFLQATQEAKSEGIVVDDDLFDAAFVYGVGFPIFRGGPLSYVRQLIDY